MKHEPKVRETGTGVLRRQLLKGAGAVAASGLAPVLAGCEGKDDGGDGGRPTGPENLFEHGVASGDPLENGVILWTRVSPATEDPVDVKWEIAADSSFGKIVGSGAFTTKADRDFTVKIDVADLEPGTTYYYRFTALGRTSPIGRTRTAPTGGVDRLRFGVVSCASLGHGYFHVYRAIAARPDLDAVLHLGDYIYEYETNRYGDVRPYEPSHEIIDLDDYRTRYSQYRRDADLQEAHRQHPFIVIYDDHETADDSYKDGAANHDPATEGSWADRKAAALQAYFEWLPIRETSDHHIFRKLSYGELADVVLLDTRLWARTQQVPGGAGPEPAPDPDRTLLGDQQEAWLEEQLTGSDAKWKLVGQQVMVGNILLNPTTLVNYDQWQGYPESRRRLIDFLRTSGVKDVVVLSGDIHSTWANEIVNDPNDPAEFDPVTHEGAAAVEFITPAITSPGFPDDLLPVIDEARKYNPHVRYLEPSLRGYIILDVTPARTQSAWFHFEDITQPTPGNEVSGENWSVAAGSTVLTKDDQAALDRPDAPDLAP